MPNWAWPIIVLAGFFVVLTLIIGVDNWLEENKPEARRSIHITVVVLVAVFLAGSVLWALLSSALNPPAQEIFGETEMQNDNDMPWH